MSGSRRFEVSEWDGGNSLTRVVTVDPKIKVAVGGLFWFDSILAQNPIEPYNAHPYVMVIRKLDEDGWI